MAVVRHSQVALPGVAPVAEQHRQRAVARASSATGAAYRVAGRRLGPHEPALVASVLPGHEVAAERQRRQGVRALPRGAERGRPAGRHVEPELPARPARSGSHRGRGARRRRRGGGRRGRPGRRCRCRSGRRRSPRSGRSRATGARRSAGPRRSGCRCGTAPPAGCRRRGTARRDRRRRSRTRRRRRPRSTRTHRRSGGRCRRLGVSSTKWGVALPDGAAAIAGRQQGDCRADRGHEQHPGRSPPAPSARLPHNVGPADGARRGLNHRPLPASWRDGVTARWV